MRKGYVLNAEVPSSVALATATIHKCINSEIHKSYDTLIQKQLQNKMIEKVSNNKISNWQEFYLPNKPVIPKKSESTKLQIVYDALVKSETRFSLNECLEEEPTLQNKLWDVLVSSRFHTVNLCPDIEKAL